MAKAIFTKAIGYTPPKGPVGWYAEASAEPQSFPEAFIAYAVEAGAATRVNAKGEPITEPEPEAEPEKAVDPKQSKA